MRLLRSCASFRPNIGTVMVVGHNPGLEELIAMLTDEWEPMPTAALAQITLQIDAGRRSATSR